MAQFEKQCEQKDFLRSIQATIMTWGGMGSKKNVSPKDVMKIPLLDNKDTIRHIKTIKEALKLLKEFKEWQN